MFLSVALSFGLKHAEATDQYFLLPKTTNPCDSEIWFCQIGSNAACATAVCLCNHYLFMSGTEQHVESFVKKAVLQDNNILEHPNLKVMPFNVMPLREMTLKSHLSKPAIIITISIFFICTVYSRKHLFYPLQFLMQLFFSLWSVALILKWQLNTYLLASPCVCLCLCVVLFSESKVNLSYRVMCHPARERWGGGIYNSHTILHQNKTMLVSDEEYENKQPVNSGDSSIISFHLSQNIKWIGQICWSDWELTQKRTQHKNPFSFGSVSKLLILQEYYHWRYIKDRVGILLWGREQE